MLKVQHVSDEQKYLQNLGRARIALMIRDAENAENEANQKIAEEQAAARQRARVGAEEGGGDRPAEAEPAARRAGQAGGAGQVDRERGGRSRPRPRAPPPSRSCSACAPSWRSCACSATWCCRPRRPRQAARGPGARRGGAPRRERQGGGRGARGSWPRSGRRPAPDGREVYLLQQLRTFVEAAVARVAQTADRRARRSWTAATARPTRPSWPTSPPRSRGCWRRRRARSAWTCARCSGSKEVRPMIAHVLVVLGLAALVVAFVAVRRRQAPALRERAQRGADLLRPRAPASASARSATASCAAAAPCASRCSSSSTASTSPTSRSTSR